jgi:hypothetical protein
MRTRGIGASQSAPVHDRSNTTERVANALNQDGPRATIGADILDHLVGHFRAHVALRSARSASITSRMRLTFAHGHKDSRHRTNSSSSSNWWISPFDRSLSHASRCLVPAQTDPRRDIPCFFIRARPGPQQSGDTCRSSSASTAPVGSTTRWRPCLAAISGRRLGTSSPLRLALARAPARCPMSTWREGVGRSCQRTA